MSLELVKLVIMCQYCCPLIYALYLLCCGGAIFCYFKSQEAQKCLNEDGFVYWHCAWHCYPVLGIIVHFLEYWTETVKEFVLQVDIDLALIY